MSSKAKPVAAAGKSPSPAAPMPAASPSSSAASAATDSADVSHARKSSAGAPPSSAAKKGGKSAPAPELAILEEALGLVSGENIAVEMVDYIVRRSCEKLTEHYAQQCAMQRTAKQAVDAIMQAIEWQLIGHDEGEKLTVRNVLLSRDADTNAAAAASNGSADDDDLSSFTSHEPAPDPLTAPHDRRRPALDLVAAKLSLPPTYNQLWRCEEEPEPADLDRWARGVIPTKAAPVSGHTPLTSLTMGATGAFTVHEALDENARSAAGSATPSQQLRSPSATQHVRGPARSAVDIARDLAAAAASTQPIKLEVVVSKEELAREKSRETELRRLEKKKKLAAEVAAVRAADDAERARLDRIQSDLRGKNYTFDARGNAILVTPAAPSSFPAIQPAPKVVVKEQYLTVEEEEEIAKKAKRNRFKKGGAPTAATDSIAAAHTISEEKTHSPPASPLKSSSLGLQRKSKKKPKASTEGFFDANASQPSLMQTLTLAKGVTLKQGPNTKLYDPRASTTAVTTTLGESGGIDHAQAELRGLTRSEYLKKIEERRAVEARFQLPAASKTTTAAVAATPAPASRSGVLVGSPGASLSRPSSSTRTQAAAAVPARGSTQALDAPQSNEEDDMGWAAQTASASSAAFAATSSASASASPLSPSATAASRSRVSQTALFNRSIASDPLWGQNPPMSHAATHGLQPRPPQPSKPAAGSPLAIGHRGPRDRPFVDTMSSQPHLRQHMPAPPPGKVTGHGLELPLSPSASSASAAASAAGSRSDSAQATEARPTSPQKPFAKIPKPVAVTVTDKAKLYFQ